MVEAPAWMTDHMDHWKCEAITRRLMSRRYRFTCCGGPQKPNII